MNIQTLKTYVLLLPLFFLFGSLNAQVTQQMALEELEKRGIQQEEFIEKMNERGVDIENVPPEDYPGLQSTIQDVIYEIQAARRLEESDSNIDTFEQLVSSNQFGDTTPVVKDTIVEEKVDTVKKFEIYGQSIFSNGNINTYKSTTGATASSSYIIGPGDRITISIWGRSKENATFDVPEDGVINPSGMPSISLKGLTLRQARKLIRDRYQSSYQFRPEEFSVTIAQSRTVVVSVYGEVENAGSYSLAAFNTAINAIVAAGGVTDLGSVRNIKIIRNEGAVEIVDIYDWIEGKTSAKDIYLYNNDVIHVPVASNVVSIQGGINRPMKYEVKEGEGIKDLVNFAGGISENGYGENISINRVANGKRFVENASIFDSSNFRLKNGDVVVIKKVSSDKERFVGTEGAFEFAGDYKYRPGMRVSDLLSQSPLASDAYLEQAYIKRQKKDSTFQFVSINIQKAIDATGDKENITLQDKDVLIVYSQKRFVDELNFQVTGAVRYPDTFLYDAGGALRVSDALLLAGNVLPEATNFAYVHRRDPFARNIVEYIRVPIDKILNNPDDALNVAIRPLDSIVVYDEKDFRDNATVLVKGEVRNPDTLLYDTSLKLSDAIRLAGGLKLEASMNRVEVTSIQIDQSSAESVQTVSKIYSIDNDYLVNGEDILLKPYDIVQVRTLPKFEFQQTVKLDGELVYPGEYALVKENETIYELIQRAGGITDEGFAAGATLYRTRGNTGFIVIELDEILENPRANSNISLKEGDLLTIPKSKEFVTIIGETRASELYPEKVLQGGRVNVPFAGRRNAKWYIDNYAAGIGAEGRSRLITVEHANGEIEKTDNYLIYKTFPEVKPGSTIKVGRLEKKIREKKEDKEKVDWERVLANSLAQATTIISLILLLQRIE